MVPQLDQQFIFGKGRRISLAERFPAVYRAENVGNLFLLEDHGEILSSIACRHFDLKQADRAWRGAMIGAVYTRPERRGEGLASRLLGEAVANMRESGLDFAVLWTDQPAFYARSGWISADQGVLGELTSVSAVVDTESAIASMPARAADNAHIERIRQRWCECLTPRRPDDYRQLPPPAETVNLLEWRAGTDQFAYALVGNHGDMSILYELIGDPAGFSYLWSELCRGDRRILANELDGSVSHCWLSANTGLTWQSKPLAMWLPLSAKLDMARVAQWYVPYFDRI